MPIPFNECEIKDGKRKYRGVWFDSRLKEWQCELGCFVLCDHGEKKFILWKNFVKMLWPEPIFFWDEWAELFFAACCGAGETVERLTGIKPDPSRKWWRQIIFWGAASTGKSAKAAIWIFGNWLAEVQFTMAVLTSTSRDILSDRIWSDIVLWAGKAQFHGAQPKSLFKIVNSELEIRWDDNDRKGMISGEAVKSGGSVEEAVDRLKGKHNRRVFVVIDEMTAVPKAIVVAARNLNKGTQEFQLIGMANPRTWNDPCGERSEPLHGRSSISIESSFWETEFGCVVRFDGLRNPGLNDRRLYFYPTQEQLDEDARESGGVHSPEYYSGVRGFIAPSGLQPTVMDEQLFEQFKVREPAIWKTIPEMAAFLDPAFEGGDRRVLYPARVGMLAEGVEGIEYLAPIIVGIDAKTDVRWIHYAIADRVQEICENYEHEGKKAPILPQNFMMDTTGEGGGLFNILSGRWSNEIRACEFGGGAERVQISPDRPTTYFELYANRVTAMWYRMRRYIEGNQVRGLSDIATLKELASRERLIKNEGGKTQIEPKSKMKKRGIRSPDLADAAVIGAEFMFVRGFTPGGKTGGGAVLDLTKWNAYAAKATISEEGQYSDEEAAYV